MNLPDGTLLQGGKYKIVRFIGSGGFGCTYEAEHVMLEKRVAVKEFFVKDLCNRDEGGLGVTVGVAGKEGLAGRLRRKFVDEARALCRLRHRGIVSVSDVFEENGTAYYVMDYIEGRSLGDIVDRRGPLPEEEALGYIRQVAEALQYVHGRKRLHLDVKPGNIMVDGQGNAVLIDFGASKQYDEANGENTSALMGKTPGYAPLEQMGNDVAEFLPATDVYALGATLYKLLAGVAPLSASRLASGEALAPLPETVSMPVRKAVRAAMETDKRRRTQSVGEFMRALEAGKGRPGRLPQLHRAAGKFLQALKASEASEALQALLAGKALKAGKAEEAEETVMDGAARPTPRTQPKRAGWLKRRASVPTIAVLAAAMAVAFGIGYPFLKHKARQSHEAVPLNGTEAVPPRMPSKLKGLNGLRGMSDNEILDILKEKFYNNGVSKNIPVKRLIKAYDDAQYIKKYGREDFENSRSYEERMEKWNSDIINAAFREKYNPYFDNDETKRGKNGEAYDVNKGLGSDYERLNDELDDQAKKELLESGYKTKPELDEEIACNKRQRDMAMESMGKYAPGASSAALGAFACAGPLSELAGEYRMRKKNDAILEGIRANSLERKTPEARPAAGQ